MKKLKLKINEHLITSVSIQNNFFNDQCSIDFT